MTRTRQDAGTSVVEALVALLLGLFLLHVGLSTLAELRKSYASMTSRFDALSADRIARTVLRRELGRGVAGEDWWATSDSIRLRAFRGWGVVCGAGAASSEMVVSYRGDRLPEPAKDSLEVTTVEGAVHRLELTRVASLTTPCAGAESSEVPLRLTAADTVPGAGVLIRVFETGSYHLVGSALRYRAGRGGRQPLTPAVWRDRDSGFTLSDSTVRVRWTPEDVRSRRVSEFLAWRSR